MVARFAFLLAALCISQAGRAAGPPQAASVSMTPLSITAIGRNTFMVRDPLTMTFRDGAPAITVPAGYVTELNSIPKRLQWWNGKTSASMAPAVIHDYLYWYQPCTREEADAVMFVAMRAMGWKPSSAAAMHRAVSSSGASLFKRHTDLRRNGDSRTLTAPYVNAVVQSASFDADETQESALEKAKASSGLVRLESASEAVRLTCARLLSQCASCVDPARRKRR